MWKNPGDGEISGKVVKIYGKSMENLWKKMEHDMGNQ